jgi:hypothetical protein
LLLTVNRRSLTGQCISAFVAAVFLVSVPVFIEAPLVRYLPWVSLAVTPLIFWGGSRLQASQSAAFWGDLLVGFAWTWLSGSLYWGWLRWEPMLHLPVEAIGLPFALWGVVKGRGLIGNLFFLGSLFGTAVTDAYFYLVDLIPCWRSLMRVEPELARDILQGALVQVGTPWGVVCATALVMLLLAVSLFSLHMRQPCWWGFAGAVASTILVDSLFLLAAAFA